MKRQALALVLAGLFAVSAGCTGAFGSGSVDEEALAEDYEYDWDTDAQVTINVTGGQYHAIYDIRNRSELAVYTRDELGTERPLELSALRFRYPNGTVTQIPASRVETTRDRAVIDLPTREGKLAFSAPTAGTKRFSTPTYIEGSYEVLIPPNMRVDVVPLAQVQPDGYRTELQGDRVHIYWEDVESDTMVVRYYFQRDLWIFAGIIALLVLIGTGGVAYYLLQIRRLERRREEVGLDVDTGDDGGGRGPPPGMR